MAIRQISLTDFRNLNSTTIDFNPDINVITGKNGSGKTNLLEAIHVICQAKSFRNNSLKGCIRKSKSGFLLFARFDDYKAGLSLTGKKVDIKVNGEVVRKRSELVRRTPIKIVNSDSFELLTGSPLVKRMFLDWCLFHVEHSYAENLGRYQHALKQRNHLLKQRKNTDLINYWDEFLIGPAIEIEKSRLNLTNLINQSVQSKLDQLTDNLDVQIAYQKGWSKEKTFKQALTDSRKRDLQTGFTQVGIHRDNLLITNEGVSAVNFLSRGQQKRLCLALQLEVLLLVKQFNESPTILLVDDLAAELDIEARKKVLDLVETLNLQLFITNTDWQDGNVLREKDFSRFHVEHGIIRAQRFG
jgi:DNA replication and repair protein RecF